MLLDILDTLGNSAVSSVRLWLLSYLVIRWLWEIGTATQPFAGNDAREAGAITVAFWGATTK
ncbi:hypothetical protein PT282_00630 [Bifidobacterium sp. ESL0763]|uniref:hypothetical protein n=1 Tax=Bifidobacterium sp. ESL0763 TaxID=2983227 RepID=UPI0023F8741E|nr:hypothetical protein [Bifidobacterium sp. ESL0763]MDF7663188.1 hypothetical protein [Bifidobacterium sp. ESL0763]